MSSRIGGYVRRNHLGLVAIFIALSGTAWAVDGPLAGQNTVGSADIINGEVLNQDLGANSVGEGKVIDDAIQSRDIADETLTGADIGDGSVSGPDILDSGLTGSDIASGSVSGADITNSSLLGLDILDNNLSGADVAPNTLTGADIDESSLAPVPDASALGGVDAERFVRAATGTGVVDLGMQQQVQGESERIFLRGQMGVLMSRCQSDGDATLRYVNSLATPRVDVADNVGGAIAYNHNIDAGGSVGVLDLPGDESVTSGQVQVHTDLPGPQQAATFLVSVQSGVSVSGHGCNFLGQVLYTED